MKFLIFLSEAMVPLMIFYIVGFGLLSGRPVLDDFIDGAKDGMKTVAGILPTLVGLLVSVGVLRASGFLDFLGELLQMPAALLHIPPQIVPVVLVRLVSNSAATGVVLDIFKAWTYCVCTHEQYGDSAVLPERIFWQRRHYQDQVYIGRGAYCHGGGSGGQRGAGGCGQIKLCPALADV